MTMLLPGSSSAPTNYTLDHGELKTALSLMRQMNHRNHSSLNHASPTEWLLTAYY